jgi:hypothetical protein
VLNDQQTNEIAEIVVVANTPAYLARRLRENGIVVNLSRAHTAQALLQYAHTELAANRDRLTLAVAARAYAAIVAGMMRPSNEIATAHAELGTPNIRWAAELMHRSPGTPSTNTNTIVLADRLTSVSSRSSSPSAKPVGRPRDTVVLTKG